MELSRHDSLYRHVELPFSEELPVLGLPVRYLTNDREVLEAVDASVGPWRGLDGSVADGPPFEIRLIVHDGDEGSAGVPPIRYRMPGARTLVVHTPGSVAVADGAARSAYAYVTRSLVRCREHFRAGILEALTLMLVTGADRHPVHAATVAAGSMALLLVGASGSGKSTLAWALERAGMTVAGDDTAYVQLAPRVTVWTVPGPVGLAPEAGRHFPELAARDPVVMPNGKAKLRVRDRAGPPHRPLDGGVRVCALAPGHERAALDAARPDEIERALTADCEEGFDLDPGGRRRVAGVLAKEGGWVLRLSPDPRDAVPEVARMLATMGAPS